MSWLFWGDAVLALLFGPLIWRQGPLARRLFGVGVLLGLAWEIPLYLGGPEFRSDPLYQLLAPLPFPAWWLPLLHSLWDGALFYLGVRLMSRGIDPNQITRFTLGMVAFGLSSALLVELTGAMGLWHYWPRSWNPALFYWLGHPITALPLAIWLVAPILFCGLTIGWLQKGEK